MTRVIKNIHTALSRKGNYFWNPKLALSSGFVLCARVCSIKWIRDSCRKNKDTLVINVRMHKNMACTGNISKQKVSLALILF